MEKTARISPLHLSAAALSVVLLAGIASNSHAAEVKLSGGEEVPAVQTSAAGQGDISVSADKKVTGSISTSGMEDNAAHIHMGARGKSGPVVLPLVKGPDHNWSVPAGATFTDAQYKAYQAGDLYVNVHSPAHKDGEIRGQLKP